LSLVQTLPRMFDIFEVSQNMSILSRPQSRSALARLLQPGMLSGLIRPVLYVCSNTFTNTAVRGDVLKGNKDGLK
jgi:hypothetical protein